MAEIKLPSLRKLVQDMEDLIKNDARYNILNLQLYAEHFVNELVVLYADPKLHEILYTYLVFPKKLEFLRENNIINSDERRILLALNSLRDKIVHRLIIDEKEINATLDSTDFSLKIKYLGDGKEEEIDLAEKYGSQGFNKYSQFNVSTRLIIGALYNKYCRMRNIEVNEYLYPDFSVEGKINILAMERAKEDNPSKK